MRNSRWSLAALVCLAACGDDGSPLHGEAGVADAAVTVDAGPDARACAISDGGVSYRPLDLDLLFMVDNSSSMAGKQKILVDMAFPSLVSQLAQLPGGLPNLHIGVVSSDLGAGPFVLTGCRPGGDNGLLQNTPRPPAGTTCLAPQGRFITDVASPSGRVRNYQGALPDQFRCIASLGEAGCGFEQQLESMKRSLDGTVAENAGFLRPDALLAVVLLSDEDDCSGKPGGALYDPSPTATASLGPLSSFRCTEHGLTCTPPIDHTTAVPSTSCISNESSAYLEPVQKYVDFLTALKGGDRSKIFLLGVIGDPTPFGTEPNPGGAGGISLKASCTSGTDKSFPGVRLAQLIHAFGNNGSVTTICASDFTLALRPLADRALTETSCR